MKPIKMWLNINGADRMLICDPETEEALNMPGVVKVITHEDIRANEGTNQMAEANLHERSTVTQPSRKVLCDDKIFRYGDVVALAIAHTPAQARAAAARVTVDIEPMPEDLNFLDAVMPDAIRVHEDTPNLFCCQPVLKGAALDDAERIPQILDDSACSVAGSLHSSREPHLSIEGCTVQAYFDEDDCLTFQCKSQGLYTSISRIGTSPGVPMDKLRVVDNFNGASFGWSTNAGDLCLAGAAAVAVNGSVALSLSCEEHQHFSGKRCPSYSNGRVACDEKGRITAAEFDIGLDHGAYSWGGDHVMEKPPRGHQHQQP